MAVFTKQGSNYYVLRLTCTEGTVNVANNTSPVNYKLELVANGWHFKQYGIGWNITINGVVVQTHTRSWGEYSLLSDSTPLVLATGSYNVAHNADGTKTVTCAASIDMADDNIAAGPISVSGNLILSTIPRKSSFRSTGTQYLNSPAGFAITMATSSFSHSITYKLGSATGTAVAKTAAGVSSVTWTPPTSLGAQFPSARTASITYTLHTWNGSTEIGTADLTVTMNLPVSSSQYLPTGRFSSQSLNNGASSVIAGWGVCVKGFTKLNWAVTASGQCGATIKTITLSFAGLSQAGTNGSSATTGTITAVAGTYTPSAKIVDSRGYETTVNGTAVSVLDYSAPVITSSSAYRSNSAGTADDDGTYFYRKIAASYSTVGGRNAITLRFRYKQANGSFTGWTNLSNNVGGTTGGLAVEKTYTVEMQVVDTVGNSKTVTYNIPSSFVTFHLRKGGNGAAFFGYAQVDGQFEIYGGLDVTGTYKKNGATSLANLTYTVVSTW